MSDFKGTKGPWRFNESSCKIVSSSSRITIADTYDSYCEYGENTANAMLIAAAPELLESLQASMGIWENHKLDVSEASILLDCRAAIAKALGESK